ncbi:Uncharacterized protein ChrSV_0596 [Chromobacterium vaccinii]|nr:Uncharacterized protein ChrSW_0596 [Chromobacterium vaccinii]QND88055.1 Uncharacterized protein ChrSV_0596 [Chromobacterium vaccinii]
MLNATIQKSSKYYANPHWHICTHQQTLIFINQYSTCTFQRILNIVLNSNINIRLIFVSHFH